MTAPNRQPFVKPGTAPAPMPAPTKPKPLNQFAYLEGKKVCVRTRGFVRFNGTLFSTSGHILTLKNAVEIDGEERYEWPDLTHIDTNCIMFVADASSKEGF